ncbi:hypothetical protein JTE90_017830 [Oedothorax gibbosus]|uniref:Protein Wnt n=1 Tax=Oedothorax gibbosus TaxID=931172 RepID=A0AAV6V8U6_9ARAC|nr:hypothetical protein JTE90_017830 [Oedothorax gibbosus]
MVARFISRILTIVLVWITLPQDAIGTWWLLSRLQASSAHADLLCGTVPGLARRQRDMCRRHPDLLSSVGRGARLGALECQHQFRHHRWNCSMMETGTSVFGNHMLRTESRESAFLYAISSAGVTHALVRACGRGEIAHCPCDVRRRSGTTSVDSEGNAFSWGGCSHIGAGMRYSRQFVDAAAEEKGRDARALVNAHNNRAGRKAVQKKSRLQCKCHGVSGSCASRTCWASHADFRAVGRWLKERYEGAVLVSTDNTQRRLVSAGGRKPFAKTDLVYFAPSPDYCTPNKSIGTLGTGGRRCSRDSQGTEGCALLCCGRGYDTTRELSARKCGCRFDWCCKVKCKTCREWKDVHTCKEPT